MRFKTKDKVEHGGVRGYIEKISKDHTDQDYPIKVKFFNGKRECFTKTGKYWRWHQRPSLINLEERETKFEEGPLLDIVSKYFHANWSEWIRHLMTIGIENPANKTITIPREYVDGWNKQANQSFYDISERAQIARKQAAQKMLDILEGKIK